MAILPAYNSAATLQSGLGNYTLAKLLAANVPEVFTVPTDENGVKAKYVVFGKGQATTDNFYAQAFTADDATDRATNGTFAEYVTNGAFGSDTGWTKGTGWSITGGKGVVAASHVASTVLTQTAAIALLPYYSYTLTYTVALTSHVTNGTFAADTDWTKGAGWTIGTGTAIGTATSATLEQDCPQTLVEGRTYTVAFTLGSNAGGSVAVSLGGGTPGTSRSTDATFTQVITAGATQKVTFTGTGWTGTLDDVTITAVGTITPSVGGTAGTARSTAATFTEAIVSDASTQTILFTADANFVGTIDSVSVTAWVLGTGWTTDGSTAIATGAIDTDLSQTANPAYPLVSGQTYLVTYTMGYTAGTTAVSLGGGTAGTARGSSATFAEIITAGTTQAILFDAAGFTGTIDNVTIIPCAKVAGDESTGFASQQNPAGFDLNGKASAISVVSAGTPIITASFFK